MGEFFCVSRARFALQLIPTCANICRFWEHLHTVAERSIDVTSLQPFCQAVSFERGQILRHKGQHYTDAYVIVDGSVIVDRKTKGLSEVLVSGSGSPIGEIGFLLGRSATATVTAKTPTSVLSIDSQTVAQLSDRQPALAAELLRLFAMLADERMSDNVVLDSTARAFLPGPDISILLCQNSAMLEKAQRLRYTVYCDELKRRSPHADVGKRTISDDLDKVGHTFIAVKKGETVGTGRVNLCSEGSVGIYEELYGMKSSKHHPLGTAVITKFIVGKAHRGGPTSIKLIAAFARFTVRNSVKEVFIDSVPPLLPYYRAIGFQPGSHPFLHEENGISHPLVLDTVKHGSRLSNERSLRTYLNMIVKAKLLKLIDSVRAA
jgi:predicted GNAT family N-acyltransferase